jgi:hypothetical protein
VSGAEIVDCEPAAERLELASDPDGVITVLRQRGLGQLERHQRGVSPAEIQELCHARGVIAFADRAARDID